MEIALSGLPLTRDIMALQTSLLYWKFQCNSIFPHRSLDFSSHKDKVFPVLLKDQAAEWCEELQCRNTSLNTPRDATARPGADVMLTHDDSHALEASERPPMDENSKIELDNSGATILFFPTKGIC